MVDAANLEADIRAAIGSMPETTVKNRLIRSIGSHGPRPVIDVARRLWPDDLHLVRRIGEMSRKGVCRPTPSKRSSRDVPRVWASKRISVGIWQGIGDSVHFLLSLPLYVKRGYRITVATRPREHWMYCLASVSATDCKRVRPDRVYWADPASNTEADPERPWITNKNGINIGRSPMPEICSHEELWHEYLAVELSCRGLLEPVAYPWTRPVILVQGRFGHHGDRRSMTPDYALQLYRALAEVTGGTIVAIDGKAPRMVHEQIRYQQPSNVQELLAAIQGADLFVGVDSGPLHLAALTDSPAIGIWTGHNPACFARPRQKTYHMGSYTPVPGFNMIEQEPLPESVAHAAERIINLHR